MVLPLSEKKRMAARMRVFLLVSGAAVLGTLFACSGAGDETVGPSNALTDPLGDDDLARRKDAGAKDGGHKDSGVIDSGRGDAGQHDASADAGDGGPFKVGTHPPFPVLVRGRAGRGVLTAPVIVPIFFPGFDHTTDVKAQLKDMGTVETYWHDAVSEYGVGAYTFGAPVDLTEAAPKTIGGGEITTWLTGKLDGTHPEFGTPTNETIYVIYYPSTTAISGSCSDPGTGGHGFGGYHDALQTKKGVNVAYGVIAECATFGNITNSLDMVTVAGSHEIIEAATDTLPGDGFASIDATNGFALDIFLQGNEENGDLCAVNHAFLRPGGGYPYLLSRGWSNAAAAAGGRDPCQPALPDQPFIGAAPVMPDTVTVGGT
jgi:hypothetical protein